MSTIMQESSLSSEIKPLDEKMAQELADAFSKCLEDTEKISGMFEHIFQLAMQDAVTASACTVVKYATRAVKATFLTRWYWDRKARKAYNNFFDMCEYVKNEISKSGMKLVGTS